MAHTPLAIVDTGPLVAAVDAGDKDHQASVRALELPGLQLIIPAMVVAEATYLVERNLGPQVEAAFLEGLADLEIVAPAAQDWDRIAELVRQYADFPLGGTDASIVALAERLGTEVVITLDRRHFGAIRPRHCPAFRLLP